MGSVLMFPEFYFLFSVRRYKSQIAIPKAESTSSSDGGFVPKATTSSVSLGRLYSSDVIKVEQPDTVLYEEIPELVATAHVTTEIQCADNAAYQVGLRKNK